MTPTKSTLSAFGVIAERFRRAGQAERAVAVCREGLDTQPEHLSARVTLGLALMDLGKDYEALAALAEVRRRAPDNLAALRGMAELHARDVTEDHASPRSFEIEDVFAAAMEPDTTEEFNPEVEFKPAAEFDPAAEVNTAMAFSPIEVAEPEIASEPQPQATQLAVFEGLLDRVHARRLVLLSEYAAG